MLLYNMMNSILGTIYIVSNDDFIIKVLIDEEQWIEFREKIKEELVYSDTQLLQEAVTQLKEYFSGDRKVFDLPLYQTGTDFQRKVWKSLQNIPYGNTLSYLDIAESVNSPKAVRAVGQANRRNNLPIIVPCHRVIGKNNSLTGYAGNKIDLKEKLLQLEGVRI
ncbi:methylated-DNA--[protein]-cysteine S-methyltransferase [Bacillus pinisoli]|uniref:methylated-DNA--[protein]-cysteine S-methyltransferase n=1 Tax=Bacillus pinisoli TaxID=2901866 RepID=UPI002342F465|nr:methylated-DNA--[protein]-cysteine S-methyltransferase [Bacillus pinisoli]